MKSNVPNLFSGKFLLRSIGSISNYFLRQLNQHLSYLIVEPKHQIYIKSQKLSKKKELTNKSQTWFSKCLTKKINKYVLNKFQLIISKQFTSKIVKLIIMSKDICQMSNSRVIEVISSSDWFLWPLNSLRCRTKKST
jgi:hypothetical protein